jgi:hypothetical protein
MSQAITGSLTAKGVTLPNAYVQIVNIFGNAQAGWSALLRVYATQATFTADPTNYAGEENMTPPAPYVAGQDAYATCIAHMTATGGQFAGFVPA